MYRILIWGHGLYYNQYINAIKYQEFMGNIKVVGVTGRERIYTCLDGYPFIPVSDLAPEHIDYIVIASEEYYVAIRETAIELGFQNEHIIKGKVFCLPLFQFDKYIDLLHSKVSIIANNCWGGTAYHALGLQFLSPFINMFEYDEDYLRLLKNLDSYLELKPEFVRNGYNPILERDYPICKLDDIELHFNHYINMEEVEKKWYERLTRLNWDNLFVMMATQDPKSLEIFDRLPYKKKICFVPSESSLRSAFYLQTAACQDMKNVPFWEVVNKTASGYFHDYDLIELLSTGTINHNRYYINERNEGDV